MFLGTTLGLLVFAAVNRVLAPVSQSWYWTPGSTDDKDRGVSGA